MSTAELVLTVKDGEDVQQFAAEMAELLSEMPVLVSVLDGADHVVVRGDVLMLAHLGDHLHAVRTA